MTKDELRLKIVDYKLNLIDGDAMDAAVDAYSAALIAAKPIVSGSLPPFPDDERIAVESITQGSKEVGVVAISQVYFRKGAKWMRGQLGGNDR